MTSWVLILFILVGDAPSVDAIHGFSSEAECLEAGRVAVANLTPSVQFRCIKRSTVTN